MNKHYHLIGIGGIGMGGLASLLMAKGHEVSGSDIKDNALVKRLRKQGARIAVGHDQKNIGRADIVVYSSAVGRDNPEMREASRRKIPIFKRARVLAEIMKDHVGITVAGAHGKTTTTSMIAHILRSAGLDPTVAVGGIVNNGVYNASLGRGKYFLAEVDESDGSFLYFSADVSVITNMDFEHVDYYRTWDNVRKAYTRFIKKTRPGGCLVGCGEDANLRELFKGGRREFLTYGFSENNDLLASHIESEGYLSRFDVSFGAHRLGSVALPVPGRHNVLNALACLGVGLKLKLPFGMMARALENYRGVQRRFQVKLTLRGICVVDDYGHHPTEIKATLSAAEGLNPKRLVVVFQPHRYTRTKYLLNEFVEAFKRCDDLIVTDIYAASEKPIEGISAHLLCEKLKEQKGPRVRYLPKDQILEYLLRICRPGDLILTLGAGDINVLSDELSKRLRRLSSQGVQRG